MTLPATPQDAVRQLARLREEIELLDRQIIELVVQRARLAEEAGEAKRVAGLPLLDPVREARVMETAAEAARQAGIPDADVRQIFRLLITIARKSQEVVP
ncbi:MAG: chorismate mutase [Gemmatimonadaceae bacterium]|nr:chorismate mutase [Gemmatimonadaceae bacterium]